MKPLIFLWTIAVSSCSLAQPKPALQPEWRITLKVIDGQGLPLPNADARVGYLEPSGSRETTARKEGKTDTNGLFTASGRSFGRLYLSASAVGYYPGGRTYDLPVTSNSRYTPWDPLLLIELRQKVAPIPMCAKRVRRMPPELGKAVAYDLEAGDWAVPYGKGAHADILFTATVEKRGESDWDYALRVHFPNPGDGIQEFSISDLDEGTMLSPHEAPPGGYEPEFLKTLEQRPGAPHGRDKTRTKGFFFRVRTVLDGKGSIKTANYGKIYGDFMDFRYYLNPEPNSRNVEFDPARNLLKNLSPAEDVREP